MCGENIEPIMNDCDFAITHSVLSDHTYHMRLPIWAWDIDRGYKPDRVIKSLVKSDDTDWEKIDGEDAILLLFAST